MPADHGGTIPAIALSAFTTAESKQKAFESGFQLYATKPFEPEKLVADIYVLTAAKSLNLNLDSIMAPDLSFPDGR